MADSVRLEGEQKLLITLKDINDFRAWSVPVVIEVMEFTREILKKEPRKAPGAFSRLATPGQRRAYWAKVSSGEIQHGANGYVRTHKQRDSWASDISSTQTRVRGEVYNDNIYGPWVQGATNQQPFNYVSGWVDTEDALNEADKKTGDLWGEAIMSVIND